MYLNSMREDPRRNAFNQDFLEGSVYRHVQTPQRASRKGCVFDVFDHPSKLPGMWFDKSFGSILAVEIVGFRHDQTVDVFSFRHAKRGPERIDLPICSKRVAS